MRSKLTVKAAEALLSLPHYTCGHTVKMEVLLHSGRATLYGVIFRTINSRGNCSHSNVCFSRRMRSRPHVSPSVSLMVVIFFFFLSIRAKIKKRCNLRIYAYIPCIYGYAHGPVWVPAWARAAESEKMSVRLKREREREKGNFGRILVMPTRASYVDYAYGSLTADTVVFTEPRLKCF